MPEAAHRIAAAKPAVEATEKKLESGETLGVVEIAPLVSLTNLVLDINACIEQVAGERR